MKYRILLVLGIILTSFSNSLAQGYELWGWGANNLSQLGKSDSVFNIFVPTLVNNDTDWKTVSLNSGYTVALKNDNSLWLIGKSFWLPLVPASKEKKIKPEKIGNEKNWDKVSCGRSYTLLIKQDGSLWGWGRNTANVLGNDSIVANNYPVRLGNDFDWKEITTSTSAFAIKQDGSLWGWGSNEHRQLGDSNTENKKYPTLISKDKDWKSVIAQDDFYMAMKEDGSLWAWGRNEDGQLGNSSTFSNYVISQVGNDKDWKSFSISYNHVLAVKEDGSLWGWGSNRNFQIVDSNSWKIIYPFRIGKENDWVSVFAGEQMSIGLKQDGSLWGFGLNINGSLGIETQSQAFFKKPQKLNINPKVKNVFVNGNTVFALRENITSINTLYKEVSNLSLSPNPIEDQFSLQYTSEADGDVRISLINITGAKVADLFSGLANAGANNYNFNIANYGLASGVYTLQIESGGNITTQKVVIAR